MEISSLVAGGTAGSVESIAERIQSIVKEGYRMRGLGIIGTVVVILVVLWLLKVI